MRLSDVGLIRRLLSDGDDRIVITPMLDAARQIGPSSIDVHLGNEFLVGEGSALASYDPLMSREQHVTSLFDLRLTKRHSVKEPFWLHPREFVLSSTLEYVVLPSDIVGRIDGRSSWARQGLTVHATAGDIHPGSEGFIVFELQNVGSRPFALYPGLPVAQITFDGLDWPTMRRYAERPDARYSGFLQTIWSAYSDESILEYMRAARRRSLDDEGVPQPRR